MTEPPPSSPPLIPGLPNDVAALILSFLPFSHHARLKPTCKSWRLFLSSKTLLPFRHLTRRLCHLIALFPKDPSLSPPFLFDPRHVAWTPLPPIPCNPQLYGRCNFSTLSVGGPHLYLIGGSLFDARSFPIDRPLPSPSTFRFDFPSATWQSLSPMLSPRGSFACAKFPGDSNKIIVAGGGSRHVAFARGGSRMRSVERYDVARDKWEAVGDEGGGMPRMRAGCVGFFVGEREFWVMGGYGEARTIAEVVPVDECCRSAAVMDVESGRWRETGDMWEGEERTGVGKIVVVENEGDATQPRVFMLDGNDIFRYDLLSNQWSLESHIPRKPPGTSSFGIIALDGELYVISSWNTVDRLRKIARKLCMQIYHPQQKTWRTLITKSPFPYDLDFNAAVMNTVNL